MAFFTNLSLFYVYLFFCSPGISESPAGYDSEDGLIAMSHTSGTGSFFAGCIRLSLLLPDPIPDHLLLPEQPVVRRRKPVRLVPDLLDIPERDPFLIQP